MLLELVLASGRGDQMLRLTGLPHVDRYPVATVRGMEERIEIHFGGRNDEQVMNVPLEYLEGEDPEAAELWLMAQLQQIGYEVRREDD